MIAFLAVECGISPKDLAEEDETMLRAMMDYIAWRNKKQSRKRG